MSGRENENLKSLGSKVTNYSMDYDPSVLETFENRHPDNDYFVKFNCPEFFTSSPTGTTGISMRTASTRS